MSPLAGLIRTPIPAQRRRTGQRVDRAQQSRRPSRAALVSALALAASACAGSAARITSVPPRPTLPAVKFVQPCAPDATVGLTAEGVEDLKNRDTAWRTYAERLESLLRSPN